MKFAVVLAVGSLAACGTAMPHPTQRATNGTISGLARDHDSGDPVAQALIHVRAQGDIQPIETRTTRDGLFGIDHLKPGRYSITAIFAGQSVDIENVEVTSGDEAVVDVTFTLGQPDPAPVDFGDPKAGEIDHFKPHHHPALGLIEGTVNEVGTRGRVAGAVVTAIGPGTGPAAPTLQAVSDAQGRYRFDPVPPGTYIISAYYSIGGRAQVEVRRSDIAVGAEDGVTVPLWVETKQ